MARAITSPKLPLLLLICLVAAIALSWDPTSPMEFQSATSQQQSLAKTYLINTRRLSYDQKGALTEILEASQVKYFFSQKYSLMDTPRLYAHNGNDQTWSATADTGRFAHNKEILHLQGSVVLTNDRDEGYLNTETMEVNLRKKIAISKVPVTITQGSNTTRAGGMVADLNKEQIRMMPNVESIYVPVAP